MFFNLFFTQWPLQKQVDCLKTKGVSIGARKKDNRVIYIYMYREYFAEVHYKNDNPDEEAEKLTLVKGLKNLNEYLEKEFKATF